MWLGVFYKNACGKSWCNLSNSPTSMTRVLCAGGQDSSNWCKARGDQKLALLAIRQGISRWKIIPKLHCVVHLAEDALAFKYNFKYHHCFKDEDNIGLLKSWQWWWPSPLWNGESFWGGNWDWYHGSQEQENDKTPTSNSTFMIQPNLIKKSYMCWLQCGNLFLQIPHQFNRDAESNSLLSASERVLTWWVGWDLLMGTPIDIYDY